MSSKAQCNVCVMIQRSHTLTQVAPQPPSRWPASRRWTRRHTATSWAPERHRALGPCVNPPACSGPPPSPPPLTCITKDRNQYSVSLIKEKQMLSVSCFYTRFSDKLVPHVLGAGWLRCYLVNEPLGANLTSCHSVKVKHSHLSGVCLCMILCEPHNSYIYISNHSSVCAEIQMKVIAPAWTSSSYHELLVHEERFILVGTTGSCSSPGELCNSYLSIPNNQQSEGRRNIPDKTQRTFGWVSMWLHFEWFYGGLKTKSVSSTCLLMVWAWKSSPSTFPFSHRRAGYLKTLWQGNILVLIHYMCWLDNRSFQEKNQWRKIFIIKH